MKRYLCYILLQILCICLLPIKGQSTNAEVVVCNKTNTPSYTPSFTYQPRTIYDPTEGTMECYWEANGKPIQYIHYAPYGELVDSQQTINYDELYKFTGKERDAESGYDYFGARYYASPFSFWLSVDPLADKYPWISPYAYCGWNPIGNIDMYGDSIFIVQGRVSILYRDGNLYNSDNTLYSGKVKRYTKSVMQAFNDLSSLDEGCDLISELQNSSNNFYVKRVNNSFTASKTTASFGNIAELRELNPRLPTTGSGGIILWNSYSLEGGVNEKGETTRPPFIGLGHELAHASDANRGLLYPSNDSGKYTSSFNGVLKSEWRAVYVENILRSQAKMPLRTYYMHNTEGIGIGPLMISPAGKPIKYP